MKKIRFIYLVLISLLLGSCDDHEVGSVLDVVPIDAAFVLETQHPKEMLSLMDSVCGLSESFQSFGNQLKRLDSLFFSNEKMAHEFQLSSMAFVTVPKEGQLMGSVIICGNNLLSNKELKSVISSNGLYNETHDLVGSSYIHFVDIDTLYAFSDQRNLLITPHEELLVSMLEQIDNDEKIYSNPVFQRVQGTLGRAVPLHLFINCDAFEPCIVANEHSNEKAMLNRFAGSFKGISALDVLLKPEVLVMNGYSVPTDSSSSLRPLKYQLPVNNTIINVLPFNTNMMFHYGMSDFLSFWEEFADKELVDRWNNVLHARLEDELIAGLSEVAICNVGPSSSPVFVARVNDPTRVARFMEKLDSRYGVLENIVNQGFAIKRININGFVPDVFGYCFSEIRSCSYSFVDQYLVIANDIQEVQDVIFCYRSGRTFDLSESFISFQTHMLEASNITLFVSCADNLKFINCHIGGELTSLLKQNDSFLSNIQAFLLQFSSSKDLVYTCFNLRKKNSETEEANVLWKVNLDSPMQGNPSIVPYHASNKNAVVVFDTENQMYLIDSYGNIKWKKTVSETPISEVKVVDFNRNGQVQYLFNTANYLFLVDRDGNDVLGYPRRLLCEASNGLSVFDYGGNKNYRVMVCGTDKFVYNYDLHGEETEGWNRHRTEALVTQPVKHVVADNKDFIIVTDVNGSVRILDRQGRIRIPLKSDMKKSQNADFYENKTNHKGVILTSDEAGQLLYIANDGGLARTDFGLFSENHCFLYEDFNGDGDTDFIYLDANTLRVFNRFKKVLYSHDFDSEISTKPVFYRLSRNKRLLGIVSEKTREIYLIDENGKMIVSSGLVGETGFAIGNLKGNNEANLLTGVGNSLFNYLIY